jgi:hypothetical protein
MAQLAVDVGEIRHTRNEAGMSHCRAGGRSIAIGRAGSSGLQEALGNALRDARERTILDVEAIVCN